MSKRPKKELISIEISSEDENSSSNGSVKSKRSTTSKRSTRSCSRRRSTERRGDFGPSSPKVPLGLTPRTIRRSSSHQGGGDAERYSRQPSAVTPLPLPPRSPYPWSSRHEGGEGVHRYFSPPPMPPRSPCPWGPRLDSNLEDQGNVATAPIQNDNVGSAFMRHYSRILNELKDLNRVYNDEVQMKNSLSSRLIVERSAQKEAEKKLDQSKKVQKEFKKQSKLVRRLGNDLEAAQMTTQKLQDDIKKLECEHKREVNSLIQELSKKSADLEKKSADLEKCKTILKSIGPILGKIKQRIPEGEIQGLNLCTILTQMVNDIDYSALDTVNHLKFKAVADASQQLDTPSSSTKKPFKNSQRFSFSLKSTEKGAAAGVSGLKDSRPSSSQACTIRFNLPLSDMSARYGSANSSNSGEFPVSNENSSTRKVETEHSKSEPKPGPSILKAS